MIGIIVGAVVGGTVSGISAANNGETGWDLVGSIAQGVLIGGGDPSSIEFCHEIGLDYVSCSPFRVPIARLAAAQANIKNPRAIGDKVAKVAKDLGKGIKNLFKKNK